QLARETVVDELSILTTNARRAYLDTLLAFADDTGLESTPAFSARRHLFHRVMLLSKEGGMSSIRIAVASCVLAVASGAGSGGAADGRGWGGRRAAFPSPRVGAAQPAPPATPAATEGPAPARGLQPPRRRVLGESAQGSVAFRRGTARDRAEGHRRRGSRARAEAELRRPHDLQAPAAAPRGQPHDRSVCGRPTEHPHAL